MRHARKECLVWLVVTVGPSRAASVVAQLHHSVFVQLGYRATKTVGFVTVDPVGEMATETLLS